MDRPFRTFETRHVLRTGLVALVIPAALAVWSDTSPGAVAGAGQTPDPVTADDGGWPGGASTHGGTSPVGFTRQGFSMQGYASAVEWRGDYVYVGASTVLQTYHAPVGTQPELVHEIEVRDWIRELAIADNMLYVAARGDGLLAFDLADTPATPTLVDRVSGLYETGDSHTLEAVFNGVHAVGSRVAVARVNNVGRARGGVDALVFEYDASARRLGWVRTIDTSVRSKTGIEVPITVGLTEDGNGLYIGYGVLTGELVYVPLVSPGGSPLHADFGAPFDIATRGGVAFVAATGLCSDPEGCSMLSRVRVDGDTLVDEPLLTHAGSAAGGSVDLSGELLCFGTWSPGRYEEGYNLWLFTDFFSTPPTRRGAAGTPDWIFQIACRDNDDAPDTVYVADEWGGLEVWEADDASLTLDLETQRVPTGALSEAIWSDDSRVYSAKRGAGLWAFDASDLDSERPVVEWIDRADPGCACAGCCPPATGKFPYPPSVFVGAGVSTHGKVAALASDRNDAVPGDGYFMMFEEDPSTGSFSCVYSEPVPTWSGNLVSKVGDDIVLATTAAHSLRVYQHCPGRAREVQRVTDIRMPGDEAFLSITDVAVYGDYLFVAEVRELPLNVPDRGAVHVFRWQDVAVACPDLATQPLATYLGSFAEDVIARALAVDVPRNRLVVGSGAKPTFPVVEGQLLVYDLSRFDPGDPAALDEHRFAATADAADRVTHANVHQLYVDGDHLLVVDRDNGLYRYSLVHDQYAAFYPAHRGPESQAFVAELVRNPESVVPLYHPVGVTVLPSGQVVVQEHNSGRASVFEATEYGRRRLWIPFGVRP